jgi:hypothetical protein
VRLTTGGKTQTAPFELRLDPRVKVSAEDLQKQFDLRIQIREQLSRIADAVAQIDDVRAQANSLAVRLADGPDNDAIRKSAADLDQKLLKARDEVIEKRILANEDSLAYPARVDIRLAGLAYGVSNDSDSAPTEPGTRQFEKLKKLVDDQLAGWAELQKTAVPAFQKVVSDRGIPPVVVAPPDRARALQQHDEP